jgi:hypothetical protein
MAMTRPLYINYYVRIFELPQSMASVAELAVGPNVKSQSVLADPLIHRFEQADSALGGCATVRLLQAAKSAKSDALVNVVGLCTKVIVDCTYRLISQ